MFYISFATIGSNCLCKPLSLLNHVLNHTNRSKNCQKHKYIHTYIIRKISNKLIIITADIHRKFYDNNRTNIVHNLY